MKTKSKLNLLNITNKNDLLNIHKIYNLFIKIIHDNQTKWFENTFNYDELKEMFVDIFIPNIELNCLDMRCNMVSNIPIEDNIDIIPLFNLKNIMFDGKKFYFSLYLEDYQVINNVKNNSETSEDINKKENKQDDVEEVQEEYDEKEQQTEEEEEENIQQHNINFENEKNELIDFNEVEYRYK